MTRQDNDLAGIFDWFTSTPAKPKAAPYVPIGPVRPGEKPLAQRAKSGGIFDFLTTLVPKVMKTADKFGVKIPLPLNNEIASLEAKAKTLKSLGLQAADIKRLHVPRLEARKTANASQLARNITTALNQAKAQADATTRLINAALTEGRTVQEKMKFGTLSIAPTAAFFVKKKIADDTYMKAKTRFDQAIAVWQDAERRIASEPVSMVRQVGQTFYATGREAVAKTSRALVATGQAAESAIESTGALAPYAKYLPYVAIGFVGLYALSFIPRGGGQKN